MAAGSGSRQGAGGDGGGGGAVGESSCPHGWAGRVGRTYWTDTRRPKKTFPRIRSGRWRTPGELSGTFGLMAYARHGVVVEPRAGQVGRRGRGAVGQMAGVSIRPWPAGGVGKQGRRVGESTRRVEVKRDRRADGQMDRWTETTRPGGVGRGRSAGSGMVVGG
jgi:hypothetical protein